MKKAEKAIVILARIVRRKLEIFFAQLPELPQLLQPLQAPNDLRKIQLQTATLLR